MVLFQQLSLAPLWVVIAKGYLNVQWNYIYKLIYQQLSSSARVECVTSGRANASISIWKGARLLAHLGESMNYFTVVWTRFPPNSSLLLLISFHFNFPGFQSFRPHFLCAFSSIMCDSFAQVPPISSKHLGLLTQWSTSCFLQQILLQVDGRKGERGEGKYFEHNSLLVSLRSSMKQQIWVFVRLGY